MRNFVKFAAFRRESGDLKCRISEYTCPATEFERLGGKGSAKKWRQSLRLVGKHAVTQETMGKMAEDDWCANRRVTLSGDLLKFFGRYKRPFSTQWLNRSEQIRVSTKLYTTTEAEKPYS